MPLYRDGNHDVTTSVPATVARLSRIFPHLREDLQAEADLAILEADREGHDDEWVAARVNRFASDLRHASAETVPISEHLADSRLKSPSAASEPILIPSDLTPAQRERFHRDMAIQILAAAGMPMRIIGELFKLKHSRVYAICQDDLKIAAKPRRSPRRQAR